MASPYEEGFRAYGQGETMHQNPYTNWTKAHGEWNDGWREHKRHQEAKDEALDSLGWFG